MVAADEAVAVEFFDQFEHTIDDKGRLVLPSAYRDEFAAGGFVTYLGVSAALFTKDGWEKYQRRLELSGTFSREEMQILRSYASPFRLDSQNRIPIGAKLRSLVGIDRAVTIVGSGSHAAIYARDKWEELEARVFGADDSGVTLADKFADLGFL